jgi:hypothetical protein
VLPLNQLSAQLQITDTLAVAGQYFLDWQPNRLPEGGTYYGAADFLFYGPTSSRCRRPSRPPRGGPRAGRARQLGHQHEWSPAWLDGTLGVYYRKFDERQPWSAPQVVAAPGGFYRLVYAQGTQVLGVGINKNIGGSPWRRKCPSARHGVHQQRHQPRSLEGPRGDSYHGFVNATMLGNLSARIPYTAVAELAYSRWSKVRSNPNFFNAEGFPGCRRRRPASPARRRSTPACRCSSRRRSCR